MCGVYVVWCVVYGMCVVCVVLSLRHCVATGPTVRTHTVGEIPSSRADNDRLPTNLKNAIKNSHSPFDATC